MANATWNTIGGDWFVASNWDEPNPVPPPPTIHYVPTAGDDVTFNAPGPYIVTYNGLDGVDALNGQAATLAINGGLLAIGAGGGILGGLSTIAGGTFVLSDKARFTIVGFVSNAGTIALNAAADVTRLTFGLQTTPSPVSLTGGGAITLSDSANNQIFIDNSASLDNVDNVISGAGSITSNFQSLTNEAKGVFDATGILNGLTIGVPTVTNAGLLEATGSGGLQLSGDTIANVGGTISANGAGAHVDINNYTTIAGGILSAANGGLIQVGGGLNVLDGTGANAPVTITSGTTVRINDAGSLRLAGPGTSTNVIVNYGTIALDSTGDRTDLLIGQQTIASPVSLQGGGAVTLSDSTGNRIFIDNSASLDNVDNTISGAGIIASNFTSLTNEAKGVIDATGTNGLAINVPSVTNAGLLEATGSGGLQLSGDAIANVGGTISANGAGAHVDINNYTTIAGGILSAANGGLIQVGGGLNVLDGTGANAPVTITSGTTVRINDAGSLRLAGPGTSTNVIVNYGTIALDSTGDRTDLLIGQQTIASPVSLQGGGAVTLSDSTGNRIFIDNSASLDNVDNTISGAGIIASNFTSLTNEAKGVIDATGTNGLAINVPSVTNAGLLEATGSGGLQLSGDTIANAGGTISANGAGAHVDLVDNGIGSTTIVGGTLTTLAGGVIDVTNSTASLQGVVTVSGSVAGPGTLAIASGDTTFASGAALTTSNLQVANGATAEIATPLTYAGALANAGTVILDGTNTCELSGAVSGSGTIGFASGAAGTLQLDATALPNGQIFANTVAGFAPGDAIDLRGLTFAGNITSIYDSATHTLTVTEGGITDTLTLINPNASNFVLQSDNAGGTEVVCFGAGTRIRTAAGDVAVENLVVGNLAVTASGQHRPIGWIGQRTINCRRHPHSHEVMPVRIAAHAFDKDRPARDLRVSPGHSICVDAVGEVLIPAAALVNGTTIIQEQVDTITYWHVELEGGHDVILAENLPCESYLEMDNRSFFAKAPATALYASPDAHVVDHADFCRPFHQDGALVAFVRERLAARSPNLGWTVELVPFANLHLLVDGIRVDPETSGLSARFLVPATAKEVWLISDTSVPAEIGIAADLRSLGVCVGSLVIDDGFGAPRTVSADHPLLSVGFHNIEDGPQRWTCGRSRLAASIWQDCRGSFFLRVELTRPALPRWVAPANERQDEILIKLAG